MGGYSTANYMSIMANHGRLFKDMEHSCKLWERGFGCVEVNMTCYVG